MPPRFWIVFIVFMLLAACAPAPAPTTPLPVVSATATLPPAPTSKPAASPTPTRTAPTLNPQDFSDAFSATKALGRGVNMGNALEAPTEGAWGVTIQQDYFVLIRQAGFNSVRIPVRWNAHALGSAPYTIDATFFDRVDTVTGWALDESLAVILDFHGYDELIADPGAQTERFEAIWDQLARHYQKFPPQVFFELLNEPNTNVTVPLWNRLVKHTLAVIRQSNPSRMVVFGGVSWNSYDQVANLEPPQGDGHILVTYHYYNPFHFTHQGAEWADGSTAWMGTTWQATDYETSEVNAQFDQVAAWGKKNNLPILLGEFGAYSKADMASRVRWTAYIARAAEQRGFAWAYWEFCAGFGVYDPAAKTWREPLLKALIP